jgi:hypothetical protein
LLYNTLRNLKVEDEGQVSIEEIYFIAMDDRNRLLELSLGKLDLVEESSEYSSFAEFTSRKRTLRLECAFRVGILDICLN